MATAPTDNLGRPLTPGPFPSIAAIKRANKAHGGVWFDRSHTQALEETVLPLIGYAGRVFIVSQIDEDRDRTRVFRLAAAQDGGDVTYVDDVRHVGVRAASRAAETLAALIERAAK